MLQVRVVVSLDLRTNASGGSGSSQVCDAFLEQQPLPKQIDVQPNRPTTSSTSAIDRLLDSLLKATEEGDSEQLKSGIKKLRSTLQVTNGCKRRVGNQGDEKKRVGGIQYAPTYLLDAVLLADNLKALHPDTHLLLDVVRQFLSQSKQQVCWQQVEPFYKSSTQKNRVSVLVL